LEAPGRDGGELIRSFAHSPSKQQATTVKQTTLAIVFSVAVAVALLATGCATTTDEVLSPASAARLDADATSALQDLLTKNPAAKTLRSKARAILIFPDILKGGFMFGAELGNGVLRQNGRTTGYYNTVAASYGLQVGLQRFGYALFFMNDAALERLNDTGGFEIGVGPSVVLVDEGMARTLTTTTLQHDVYAFVFDQTGLMAGAGLQGAKITRIQ
jgi:lipid-binding SYLF domain-containing protein